MAGMAVQSTSGTRSYKPIILPALIVIVPMVVLPATLLGVVFHYQVEPAKPQFDDLQLANNNIDTDAYYVQLSEGGIAQITSLMADLAPILIGFAMILWSYAIANILFRKSRSHLNGSLPTPFQFGILIETLGSGYNALYDLLLYRARPPNRRSRIVRSIFLSTIVFSIFLVLNWAICLVDLWFHNALTTVEIPQILPSYSWGRYGKEVAHSCVLSAGGIPCTVDDAALGMILVNASIAYATVNNLSSTNFAELVFDGPSTYAILVDPSAPPEIDYQAQTFGISTQCISMGQACGLYLPMGDRAEFNCSRGGLNFSGKSLTETSRVYILPQFSEDSAAHVIASETSAVNPFYLALAANIDSVPLLPDETLPPIVNDPNVQPTDQGITVVLNCRATVYNVTYTRVNGTFTLIDVAQSNSMMGGMALQPLLWRYEIDKWSESLRMAVFSQTSQDLADQFAITVSQTGISLISGQLSPRLNSEEQIRQNILVSRVPKAPLFTQIVFCFLYLLFGILLAVIALLLSRKPEVVNVQKRLSTMAIVAEAFEKERVENCTGDVEEMFEEWSGIDGKRIGVGQSRGGQWRLEAS
jgi:hypothetical protein